MTKPFLIVLAGTPGSGKTYWAERLAKKLNAVHINSDVFRFSLLKRPKHSHSENIKLFHFIDILAKELLSQGMSVIYDANVLKVSYRSRLRKVAKVAGARFLFLSIQAPLATAIDRAEKRHRGKRGRAKLLYRKIPLNVLKKFAQRMEHSNVEPRIIIDGTKSFSHQWPKVRQAIQQKT